MVRAGAQLLSDWVLALGKGALAKNASINVGALGCNKATVAKCAAKIADERTCSSGWSR